MTGRSARPRALAVAVVGVLALVAVLGLARGGVLDGLESETYTARFDLRGTQPVDGVAVVAIDEATFSDLDTTWPFRRKLHARMIDRLRDAGARTIVYDVQFTEPSGSDADDLALFDAVARTPGTILATGENDTEGRTRVLGGDDQLAEIGSRAASSTFPADHAGTISEYTRQNARLDTIANATAAELGAAPKGGFDDAGRALIDFRGPAGTFPTYSFVDVLNGDVPASALAGRVVVVGATAPVLQDIHPTAASGPRLMPGPEIQANAIWTALHDNPLRAGPTWSAPLAALLLGLLGILLVLRLSPLRAMGAAVALTLLWGGAAVVLFGQGFVLPVAVPVLALLATVFAGALVTVAAEIAARVALTQYSERLERDVAARTAELVHSQLEIVLRLARAAELRDDDTGEHIDRMSTLCGDVAIELGYTHEDAELVRYAAALHDIGKIGVPDAILLKPGKLTPEEFDVMREHVVHGATLLEGSDAPVLQLAEEIARTHHEKWDGTGYPARLAGDDIPLSGRISAVCDVFDALSSERPYKRAWPPDEVRAEIIAQRGAHFDPRVVDALLTVLDRRAQSSSADDAVAEPRLAA